MGCTMRAVVGLMLIALTLSACGGGGDGNESATATRSAELAQLTSIAASQATPTSPSVAESSPSPMSEPSPTPTRPRPTSTVAPTQTPRPTATRLPTKTPQPTATPQPADLGMLLTNVGDMFGDFVVLSDEQIDASRFVHEDGFLQGRTRTLAKVEPQIAVSSSCAEYETLAHAQVALEQQHQGLLRSDAFTLQDDDASSIKTQNKYLLVGVAHLSDGDRNVAIAMFQVGRVMCFNIVLGVPGGEGAPRGGAIDSVNRPLERLAQANAPTPTPIPGGAGIYEIGEKVSYPDGFNITILAVEDPVVVNGEAVSPEASIVLVAVQVRACAGQNTKNASIGPLAIDVSLDNNTRAIYPARLYRTPLLSSANLFPGECVEGWVTFERHWQPRAVYVVVDPIGYSGFRVKAR